MKKTIAIFLSIVMSAGLFAGCNASSTTSVAEAVSEQSEEMSSQEESSSVVEATSTTEESETVIYTSDTDLTFENKFTFDGFEVTLHEGYSFEVIDNEFSDHHEKEVVKVPATLTNVNGKTEMFSEIALYSYDTEGELMPLVSSLLNNSIGSLVSMEADETTDELFVYFLYRGDGDYIVQWKNHQEQVDIKLPIVKK